MDWWMEKPFRMIQNNLRDIDAEMDADEEIRWLLSFGANVVQLGCGGITAFTPTKQPFQRKSPYLKGDKFGELLAKCHQNGIRVIARFDVSKAHESYLTTNPDWFSRSREGKPIRYNDTAATCINGPYQQELAIRIIGDVIRKYPVDGIFFNMFGYQTRDYDGNYVGICQCENCRRRFHSFSGMELPTEENPEDPVFKAEEELIKLTGYTETAREKKNTRSAIKAIKSKFTGDVPRFWKRICASTTIPRGTMNGKCLTIPTRRESKNPPISISPSSLREAMRNMSCPKLERYGKNNETITNRIKYALEAETAKAIVL